MDHVSSITERTFNPSPAPNPVLAASYAAGARPTKRVADLAEVFRAIEALDNEDVVLPLSALSLTEYGLVRIPSLGEFNLTDWSKKQLSTILGVKWDIWFGSSGQRELAEEVNRRFARGATMRIRTRRHAEEATDGSDGIVRAFVSETYSPVSDTEVGTVLETALASALPDCAILRANVTDRTTSYVVTVGRPYRPGESAEVGEVWGGILVRNSGVGYASLAVTLHLTRLVCLNGMTAPVPDSLVMRRRHRYLDRGAIREQLLTGLEDLPARLHRGADRMRTSRDVRVAEVPVEVHRLLDAAHLPRRLAAAILTSFYAEPHHSAFGVVQAVTRAAQEMTPEIRVELEHAAGRYLVEQVP